MPFIRTSNVMMKRFLPFLLFFTLLTFLYFPAVAQENETRLDGATLCPGSQFVVPVHVSNLQNVDSLSLTILIPGQTLSYLSFRQINPLFQTNSFVVQVQDNKIVLSWKSATPVSITCSWHTCMGPECILLSCC